MDVILYQDREQNRLGHVLSISQNKKQIEVQPLVLEDNNVWKVDMSLDSSQEIERSNVIKTIKCELSQKQDMNRVRNPHSEHAYDIWEVEEQLQMNVFKGEDTQ
eukprot:TRINITY_DN1845_c2_g1_i2.p5 TRINITY_DN1845_c2_g1~~TRINITY_DN1845_c2_g1_i2.p5  ORF type:complete len:104 (-),score=5.80 TRINITY_DN1845_c2_g1_i2:241-552(-)